jgi:alkylation response protein AidB-like acyl-CoA dehydrogenase
MLESETGEADGPVLDQTDAEALRESIARVLGEACDSRALHEHLDGKARLDSLLWERAAELGWLAIGLPAKIGGLGAGVAGLNILHTELGRCAAPGAFLSSLSFGQALLACDDPDILTRWLPALAAGAVSAAVPADFQQAGGKESYTLIGSADAAVALLPRADGKWCLAELADAARVSQARMWDRTRSLIDVAFDDAKLTPLPNAQSVGRRLKQVLALALAADSLGGARGIAERTLVYMKDRHQFGRPIASFQALKHRMADHFTLVAHLEHVIAHGLHARLDGNGTIWAAMAKARASTAYSAIAADCVQLHGGVGFAWEYDPHIFQKRADLNEALLMNNRCLVDEAADDLVAAVRAGEPVLEL